VETLGRLLYLLGEDLQLGASPRDSGIDATLIDQQLQRSPTERLDYGIAFANFVIANSPCDCAPRRQIFRFNSMRGRSKTEPTSASSRPTGTWTCSPMPPGWLRMKT